MILKQICKINILAHGTGAEKILGVCGAEPPRNFFYMFINFIKKLAAKPRPPEGDLSGNAKLERTFMTCHVHK